MILFSPFDLHLPSYFLMIYLSHVFRIYWQCYIPGTVLASETLDIKESACLQESHSLVEKRANHKTGWEISDGTNEGSVEVQRQDIKPNWHRWRDEDFQDEKILELHPWGE